MCTLVPARAGSPVVEVETLGAQGSRGAGVSIAMGSGCECEAGMVGTLRAAEGLSAVLLPLSSPGDGDGNQHRHLHFAKK